MDDFFFFSIFLIITTRIARIATAAMKISDSGSFLREIFLSLVPATSSVPANPV